MKRHIKLFEEFINESTLDKVLKMAFEEDRDDIENTAKKLGLEIDTVKINSGGVIVQFKSIGKYKFYKHTGYNDGKSNTTKLRDKKKVQLDKAFSNSTWNALTNQFSLSYDPDDLIHKRDGKDPLNVARVLMDFFLK